MPKITQRVFMRMVTEVEVITEGQDYGRAYVTTEDLQIPAGTKIYWGDFVERGTTVPTTQQLIFEQDLEIVPPPPPEEPRREDPTLGEVPVDPED